MIANCLPCDIIVHINYSPVYVCLYSLHSQIDPSKLAAGERCSKRKGYII